MHSILLFLSKETQTNKEGGVETGYSNNIK